jgi:hypothetical protein
MAARQLELQRSAAATSWPDLTPAIEDLPDSRAPEWIKDGCLNVDASNMDDCVYGSGKKLAVVLGDSVAISYMPAIRAALEPKGWRIQVLTRHQCPAVFISVKVPTDGKVLDTACDTHHDWVKKVLPGLKADMIIVSSAENSLRNLASGSRGAELNAEWKDATAATLDFVSAYASRTVLLEAPPLGNPLATCATRLNGPSDCNTSTKGTLWVRMTAAEKAAVDSLAPQANTTYADTRSWFCTDDDQCPALYGSTPIRVDAIHLTAPYSGSLGKEMRAMLGVK